MTDMEKSRRKFLQQAALAGTGLALADVSGLLASESNNKNNEIKNGTMNKLIKSKAMPERIKNRLLNLGSSNAEQ